MKYLITLIFFFLASQNGFAQTCEQELIRELRTNFDSIQIRHEKTINKYLTWLSEEHNISTDSVSVLYVLSITYRENIREKTDSAKISKFFCYYDANTVILEDVYILKDDFTCAFLSKVPYEDSLRLQNSMTWLPVSYGLSKLNSDLVFTLDWVNCFFIYAIIRFMFTMKVCRLPVKKIS